MRVGTSIYLDHQATTPLDRRVFAEMAPYLGKWFGNAHSLDHYAGWRAAQAVEEATARVSGLIGADPDEIVFTSGATEANNLALLGLGRRAAGGKRLRILVSAIEHKSVLAVSRILRGQLGYSVEPVPVDAGGRADMAALQEMLADDVLIVSIMAVNNEIGTIQDISEISRVTRERGAFFHCDASQAPCATEMGDFSRFVDLLSLSAHKMYGPQGIGALFIRRELQDRLEPIVYGGGQQHGLRSGTVPVALCVGMGGAAILLRSGQAAEERALVGVRRDAFVSKLRSLSWPIVLNGPKSEQRHPGNANMRFEGFDAHDILNSLQPKLSASTGSACTSGFPEPSHVLRAIGLSDDEASASIRFSIGSSTTEADLDEAVGLIETTLPKLASANVRH
jgi:cysteine desulfurase